MAITILRSRKYYYPSFCIVILCRVTEVQCCKGFFAHEHEPGKHQIDSGVHLCLTEPQDTVLILL